MLSQEHLADLGEIDLDREAWAWEMAAEQHRLRGRWALAFYATCSAKQLRMELLRRDEDRAATEVEDGQLRIEGPWLRAAPPAHSPDAA